MVPMFLATIFLVGRFGAGPQISVSTDGTLEVAAGDANSVAISPTLALGKYDDVEQVIETIERHLVDMSLNATVAAQSAATALEIVDKKSASCCSTLSTRVDTLADVQNETAKTLGVLQQDLATVKKTLSSLNKDYTARSDYETSNEGFASELASVEESLGLFVNNSVCESTHAGRDTCGFCNGHLEPDTDGDCDCGKGHHDYGNGNDGDFIVDLGGSGKYNGHQEMEQGDGYKKFAAFRIKAPEKGDSSVTATGGSNKPGKLFRAGSGNDCKTWQEARDICQSKGGDLVSVTSAEKQKVVADYMKTFSDYGSCQGPYPWVGGTNCNKNTNKCEWVDGSEWDYRGPTNWNVDDPKMHFYTDGGWGTWGTDASSIGLCEEIAEVYGGSFKGYVNDGLSKGDEVVLLHMQSLGTSLDNVEKMDLEHFGHYEFHQIKSITEEKVEFEEEIEKNFFDTSSAGGKNRRTQQLVVMQRVPNFKSAVIKNGNLWLDQWRHAYGAKFDAKHGNALNTATLFMRVQDSFVIGDGVTIDGRGAGFSRGMRSSSGYCHPGGNGESPNVEYYGNDNPKNDLGKGGPIIAGGGGHGGDLRNSWCKGQEDHAPTGGGGASYQVAGGTGSNNNNPGSAAYGDAKMKTFFLGSGGGGGSAYRHNSGAGYGGYGGTGGGAIMIFANKFHMSPTAQIDMGGSDGTSMNMHGGAGGGGSGGSVFIQCGAQCDVEAYQVRASGGQAGAKFYANAFGGAGSPGRVRVAKATRKTICVNDKNDDWACEAFDSKDDYCKDI